MSTIQMVTPVTTPKKRPWDVEFMHVDSCAVENPQTRECKWCGMEERFFGAPRAFIVEWLATHHGAEVCA